MRRLLHALVVAVAALPAAAQQNAEEQALGEAIREARRELADERRRIADEEQARQTRTEELVAQRNALSDRLVDLKLEVAAGAPVVDKLREQRATLRGELEPVRKQVGDVPRLLRDSARKVVDMLEVLPPSNTRPQPGDVSDGAIAPLVDQLDALLAESQNNGFFRTSVRAPDGSELEVDVARLGMVAWAYRTVDGGRVALAMNAPGLDETFRWLEDLSPESQAEIGAAMDLAASGSSGVVSFPLDVTVQMETESETRQKTLSRTLLAGGPVMVPLGAVALLAILLILERLVYLGRVGGVSRLAQRVVEESRAGQFDQAVALCNKRRTPTTRALAACLEHREQGVQAMEDAVQEAVLHELPRMERFLPTIGILASVAPLMGLLGTVTGMILTFEMIATLGSGNPRIMAGGISQALITTASGLVVAIPILLMHSFLAGRVDRLIADTERYAATVLNLLRGER